jgi:hypothetical protein
MSHLNPLHVLICGFVQCEIFVRTCKNQIKNYVKFEVFTAMTMGNGVFCDVTPCGPCKSTTDYSSICLIPTSQNRPSTCQLLRIATEHSSTCNSFPQATTGLVPISYRGALLSTLLHVSLILKSYNSLEPISYRGALLKA